MPAGGIDKSPVRLDSLVFETGPHSYCLRCAVLFFGESTAGHYTCVKYVQCQGQKFYVLIDDGNAKKLASPLAYLQQQAQGICALLFERRDTASLLTQPESIQVDLAGQQAARASAMAARASAMAAARAARATPERAADRAADSRRKKSRIAAESTPEQLKRKATEAGRIAAKRAATTAPKPPAGAKPEADSAADAEEREHARRRRAAQKSRKAKQHAENVALAPSLAVEAQPRKDVTHTYKHRHRFTPVPDGLKVRPRVGTDQWKSMDASRAQLKGHLASQQFFQASAWVPNAFQDNSHTMKAGFLAASLLDKIKASKTCEACS